VLDGRGHTSASTGPAWRQTVQLSLGQAEDHVGHRTVPHPRRWVDMCCAVLAAQSWRSPTTRVGNRHYCPKCQASAATTGGSKHVQEARPACPWTITNVVFTLARHPSARYRLVQTRRYSTTACCFDVAAENPCVPSQPIRSNLGAQIVARRWCSIRGAPSLHIQPFPTSQRHRPPVVACHPTVSGGSPARPGFLPARAACSHGCSGDVSWKNSQQCIVVAQFAVLRRVRRALADPDRLRPVARAATRL